MRFNVEPFERLNFKFELNKAKMLAQKAEENLKKHLTKPENIMLNYDTYEHLDARTGKLFTGKFIIPADRFERIVKVYRGQELSNFVREKTGEKIYLEVLGHEPKYFKTAISAEEKQAEINKMLEADQKMYNRFIERFVSKTN